MSPWVYPLCSRVVWAAAGAAFRLGGAALAELMFDAHAFSRTLPLPITAHAAGRFAPHARRAGIAQRTIHALTRSPAVFVLVRRSRRRRGN